MAEKEPLRYEDAAELVTLVVWRCKKCGRGLSMAQSSAEEAARVCCAEDCPCITNGCPGRVLGRRGVRRSCDACEQKEETRRWQEALAKRGVDWDGTTPLCQWRGDRFFFDADAVQEYLDEHELKVADVRLQLCEQATLPEFEMAEYLSDELPEDDDTDFSAIDRIVNEWIKANVTPLWYGSGPPVRPESLGLRDGNTEG